MPIYEYECTKCKTTIEKLYRKIPEDGPPDTIEEKCKKCVCDGCECSKDGTCTFKYAMSAHGKHGSWGDWNMM